MTLDNVTHLKLCLKMCFLFWCSILSLYTLLCFLRKSWKSASTGSSSWWSMANSPIGFRDTEAPSLPWDLLSMFQHHLSWLTAKNSNAVNYILCSYIVLLLHHFILWLHSLLHIDIDKLFYLDNRDRLVTLRPIDLISRFYRTHKPGAPWKQNKKLKIYV